MASTKANRRQRIQKSIRRKISGTSERPRLSIFRSNTSIYAQIIDDSIGATLISASSRELEGVTNATIEVSKNVGKILAEKAVLKGISSVVFDRSGYLYHGKVKALADGARDGGLKF
ncbi:MAG: 50S ribosomal protein L18 [Bacteroidota bacterium]